MLTEEVRTIQLKSAIYIPYTQAKDGADQQLPTPGIEFTHPGILTIDTVAQDSIILVNQREKALKITNIKLSIRIHEKGQVFAYRLKATDQCCTIAAVNRMIDQMHTSIGSDDILYNGSCIVFAAIIHNDDFKVLHPRTQHIYHGIDRFGDNGLLIVRW